MTTGSISDCTFGDVALPQDVYAIVDEDPGLTE